MGRIGRRSGRHPLRQSSTRSPGLSDDPDARARRHRRCRAASAQYMIHCASCHGLDRRGDAGRRDAVTARLSERLTPRTGDEVVMQGGGRMPAFSQLPEAAESSRSSTSCSDGADRRPARRRHVGPADEGSGAAVQEPPSTPSPDSAAGSIEEGYPAIKPPWGTLNAVDLNTGEIKWKVPLGEYPELTKRGIPPTGTENYGGPVVTAGGADLHRRHRRRNLPRLRQGHGQDPVAGEAAIQRHCHAEHLHGRGQTVRRDLCRRRQVGAARRRHHRRLRPA